MAHEFLLQDKSGRGITTRVEIDYVLEHFGKYKNDPDNEFEESVGEWAMSAETGDSYHMDDEKAILIALDDTSILINKGGLA